LKVELRTDVLTNNNLSADFNRDLFTKTNTLVVNLMSSPGAGKTTTLCETIRRLSSEFKIAVIEGDLATSQDADRIRETGAQAVQINTHGGCHLDARMIASVLPEFDFSEVDILFIENVGNLVCPSGYDLGQTHKVAVLSVPEGNDKIPKYPTMFMRTELVLLNKIDILPFVDFDIEMAKKDLEALNANSSIISLSARSGEGFDTWIQWIKDAYNACQKQ
jgi:hydrogenase nickel incorporation protein HypB